MILEIEMNCHPCCFWGISTATESVVGEPVPDIIGDEHSPVKRYRDINMINES